MGELQLLEANPQPDIFVRYSKELLKAKMRVRIGGVQNQVWEAIMVLTYGHVPSTSMAKIQNKDISELTGLSTVAISKAKKNLLAMNMIVTNNGKKGRIIGIQKKYNKWRVLHKKITKNGNDKPESIAKSGIKDDVLPKMVTTGKLPKMVTKFTKNGNKIYPTPIIVKEKEYPPIVPPKKICAFDTFWESYPKKKSKGQARKTWDKLSKSKILPSVEVLLDAVEKQKRSFDWKKDNGKFIPYPSTWLNAYRWEDEVDEDDCPHKEILKLYHTILPELTHHKVWDGNRAENLSHCWSNGYLSNGGRKSNTIEYWEGFFKHIRTSDKLMGRVPLYGKEYIKCSLDWIVKKENFEKIIEGKYHRQAQ